MTAPRPAGEVAQMTYTSFEGGWQVKQSDGLSPAEQDDLVRQVPTRLSLLAPLPRFPSADDLDALPRRLTYDRRGDDAVFLHAAQAGDDGAGRPGNVFTHAVVVRQHAGDSRPIELWRSPRWLTPFGQPAVRAAEYDPQQPPAPHPGTGRAAAVDFVLDPSVYRFSGMSLLLDAVAEALDGGRPVVLVAGTVDEGASWLALACWMAAAPGVADLSFSTYERGADVLAGVDRRVSVVVRDDLDVPRAVAAGVLVVDPSWECELREEPGRSVLRTPAGQDVAVTEWSGLALDVLTQVPDDALATLELADRIAGEAPEQARACAWWPLAVAVAMTPDLSMTWPSAARVVVSRTLDRALPDHLRKACTDVVQISSGTTADEAWSLLQHCSDNEALLSIVFPAYVERVLEERQELLGEQRRQLPLVLPPRGVLAALLGRCAPVLSRAVEQLQTRPRDVADPDADLYLLRLVDFVLRAGVPVREYLDDLAGALGAAVADRLVDDGGAELLQRCGLLSHDTWRLVGPALDARLSALPGPPGQRLAKELHRQLEASVCPLSRLARLSLEEARTRELDQEVAVAACRGGRWPSDVSRAVPVAALLWSPTFAPEARPDPSGRTVRVLDELRVGALTLDELEVLTDHFAHDPVIDLVEAGSDSLLELEYPTEGAELAARLLKTRAAKTYDPTKTPRVELEVVSRLRPSISHATRRQSEEVRVFLLFGLDLWLHLDDHPEVRRRFGPHLLVAAIKVAAWPMPQGWSPHGRDGEAVGRRIDAHQVRPDDLIADGLGQAVALINEDLAEDPSLVEQLVRAAVKSLLSSKRPEEPRSILLAPVPRDLAARHDGMTTVVAAVLRPYWIVRGGRAAQEYLSGQLHRWPEEDHKAIRAWWGEFAPHSSRLSQLRKGSS